MNIRITKGDSQKFSLDTSRCHMLIAKDGAGVTRGHVSLSNEKATDLVALSELLAQTLGAELKTLPVPAKDRTELASSMLERFAREMIASVSEWDTWVSVDEMIEGGLVPCRRTQLYQLLRDGKLKGVKSGPTWKVRRSEVEKYFSE